MEEDWDKPNVGMHTGLALGRGGPKRGLNVITINKLSVVTASEHPFFGHLNSENRFPSNTRLCFTSGSIFVNIGKN